MPKYIVSLMTVVGILIGTLSAFGENATPEQMVEKMHWLGQATVKIEADNKVIYFDPLQIKKAEQADVILITYAHQDHFSPNDLEKLVTEKTVLIAPKDVAAKLGEKFKNEVIIAEPGMSTKVGDMQIEVIPAYNVVKTKFHPKDNKWVGYVVTIDGVRIYHAGDTERIPEMKDLTCDIVLLPLGQTYTMNNVQEAADAALDVKAKIAIPIHYGLYEGKTEDATEFSKLLKDKVSVIIKPKE
jgi:L-ascorbate metabolism protein UlaG (beta-lactamase superfamily)